MHIACQKFYFSTRKTFNGPYLSKMQLVSKPF